MAWNKALPANGTPPVSAELRANWDALAALFPVLDAGEAGIGHVRRSCQNGTIGNVGAGEDNLMTENIEANTLGADGRGIIVDAGGTTAANANSKRWRLYLGTVNILDFTATSNNLHWWLQAK